MKPLNPSHPSEDSAEEPTKDPYQLPPEGTRRDRMIRKRGARLAVKRSGP